MDERQSPDPTEDGVPVCVRHPERESHLRCRSCGRPACPECQHVSAGGGFLCPDCAEARSEPRVAGSANTSDRPRTRDDDTRVTRGRAQRPVVTYVIAVVCAAVYALQWLFPRTTALGDFSAISGYVEPWRFLTAAFLHSPATATHLLFNLMGLYVMGQFLEPLLGRARFVAVYLLSAVGGSVGYLLLLPALTDLNSAYAWSQPVVGASGAVFGLFGAAFLVLRKTGSPVAGMIVLLVINAVLPFFYPNIAWQAHLGGAVTGLVATGLVLATISARRRKLTWPALAVVGVALIAAALVKYQLNAVALDGLRITLGQ